MDDIKMPFVKPATMSGSMVQPAEPPVDVKKDNSDLIKLIIIIIISLIALTFFVLFLVFLMKYNTVSKDVNEQIAVAVAEAKEDQAMELEAEFAEREKTPYRDFAGPIDYGQLSFKYPRTWSVYIAQDAVNGGDFAAYLNPIEVYAPSNTTIDALSVYILDEDFETVIAEYQKEIEKMEIGPTVEATTVGGTTANRYTGNIPGTDLVGIFVVFKIRDKTVVMQTDSLLFKDDFDKILGTVKFNA